VITTRDVVALELLEESVAVHVTVVVPTGKLCGLYVIVGAAPESSVAVAGVSTGIAGNVVVANDWSAAGVMTGGVVSVAGAETVIVTVAAVEAAGPSKA
jgi:hypothetical protein